MDDGKEERCVDRLRSELAPNKARSYSHIMHRPFSLLTRRLHFAPLTVQQQLHRGGRQHGPLERIPRQGQSECSMLPITLTAVPISPLSPPTAPSSGLSFRPCRFQPSLPPCDKQPSLVRFAPARSPLQVQIRLSIQRLRTLQEKKLALAKKSRREIADLLTKGRIETARLRVEGLIQDDIYVELLELLEVGQMSLEHLSVLASPLFPPLSYLRYSMCYDM